MNKVITYLNPYKIYVKSQNLIAIILISLSLCLVSWWFIIPTLILTLFNLIHSSVTIFEFDNGKKIKTKVTKQAWREYRKNNSIPWKAQWDYYQIASLIPKINSKVQHVYSQPSDEEATSTVISHPKEQKENQVQKATSIKEQEEEVTGTIQKRISQDTEPHKEAIPRSVRPLPKLNVKIRSAKEILSQTDNSTNEKNTLKSRVLSSLNQDKPKGRVSLQKSGLKAKKIILNESDKIKRNDNFSESENSIHRNSSRHFHEYSFKVVGTRNHELSKAVSFARKEELFTPFKGYSLSDLMDLDVNEERPIYETDLRHCIDRICLVSEPDNEYDPNAIKVRIVIADHSFLIGYVPLNWTEHVQNTLDKEKEGQINVSLSGHLIGGRYQFVDEDNHIRTQDKHYGFVVIVHTQDK